MRWRRQGSAGAHPVVKVLGLIIAFVVTAWLVRLAVDRGPTDPGTPAQAAAQAAVQASAQAAAAALPTAAPVPVPVVVIGDSYTGGSDQGGYGNARWTAVAASTLDAADLPVLLTVNAVGGTGYVAHAGGTKPFPDRVAAAVTKDARIVVVFGSRNDGPDAAAVGPAAREVYADIKRLAPQAKLLVIGPPLVDADSAALIGDLRDTLKQATAAAGGTFVDPVAEGWFTGRDAGLIGSDKIHPVDAGHKYMAGKILVHLKPLVAAQYKLLNGAAAGTPSG
jgi:lysophospholipase L1-like esterase